MQLSERQRQALLDSLYLAPFNDAGWQQFLNELVGLMDVRSARMLILNREADQVHSSIQANTDQSAHRAYVDHYVNLCPWRPELKQKTPGKLYSTFLDFSCGQKDYYRSEFFNDWAKPLDIHHGACGTVWSHDELNVQLLVQRTGGQGHFCHDSMRTLNELVPHIRRALHIESLQWQQRYQQAARYQQHNCAPMILINAQGRVVYTSKEAEDYLSDTGAMAIRAEQIQLRPQRAQQTLLATLQEVLNSRRGSAGNIVSVERPGQPDLRLLVMPVHPDATDNSLFPVSAFAAIFIVDTESEVKINQPLLAELLGLTNAETRTAAAVARGMSPAEMARCYNLSVHTVRSQLKSVFRKTGTSSQAQLGNLVLSSPATQRTLGQPVCGFNQARKDS
ncbi:helix-turn-helix transcriptional regulator [Alcanivorax sp. 1008]|uniref:helix-turn-helix transcriptional regulator n=1 Tax=Alcanivorax sp. 1008 TaxID=2816853 RepID=UPI001DECECA8|nr:helix-turn-helix transcriptional regulator [Alcanivorax sp. 1008]MCC1496479.1 helix-turn-helix transcriptional regulator [Alcanivorax sp. 1008]